MSTKKYIWITDRIYRFSPQYIRYNKTTTPKVFALRKPSFFKNKPTVFSLWPAQISISSEGLLLEAKKQTLISSYFSIIDSVVSEFSFHPRKKSKVLRFICTNYVTRYSKMYLTLFMHSHNDLYSFLRKNKGFYFYHLILTFSPVQMYANLQNRRHRNYFSLSTGLLTKFFNNKKSLKKTKTLKLLLSKYLRKLCLMLQLKRIILIVNKTPASLLEVLKTLNQPIIHKFLNPYTGKTMNELTRARQWFKFWHFIFKASHSYTHNRLKKEGRVKRKVSRKVILQNRLID